MVTAGCESVLPSDRLVLRLLLPGVAAGCSAVARESAILSWLLTDLRVLRLLLPGVTAGSVSIETNPSAPVTVEAGRSLGTSDLCAPTDLRVLLRLVALTSDGGSSSTPDTCALVDLRVLLRLVGLTSGSGSGFASSESEVCKVNCL